MDNAIDIVVLYVDSTDEQWQKQHNSYKLEVYDDAIDGKQRYRQNKHFKYWFRGVAKYAPFIRNVFLVVQSMSQVPKWINKNEVKIVLHEDFIPKQFLPTYNSSTIELFLHNIKDLSEYFLYSNDDMYIIGDVTPNDFFENDKVKTMFNVNKIDVLTLWRQIFINSHKLINPKEAKILNRAQLFMSPFHQIRPYLKSKYEEAYEKYKKEIFNSISMFRQENNLTIYLYDFYLRHLCLTCDVEYNSRYFSSDSLAENIDTVIKMPEHYKTICINDTKDEEDQYREIKISNSFKKMLPDKCKYENIKLSLEMSFEEFLEEILEEEQV